LRRDPNLRPENQLAAAQDDIERLRELMARVTDGRVLLLPGGGASPSHVLYGTKHTGAAPGDLVYGDVSSAWAELPIGDEGQVLTVAYGLPEWMDPSGGAHDLLDALVDQDTVAHAVLHGDLIFGNATPAWDALGIGGEADVLTVVSGQPAWAPASGGAHNLLSTTHTDTDADDPIAGDIIIANADPEWVRLGMFGHSDGEVLTLASGLPSWAPAAAGYTDEQAQDAVGFILLDTVEIDFTYDDGTPNISATLINDSIVVGRLHATASPRLFGRSTAAAGAGEEITVGAGLSLAVGALTSTITQYTDAAAVAAVAAVLGDSATVDLDYEGGVLFADVIQAGLDHGSIGGLVDDDHVDYARLVGRSGSQTLEGGAAASENLILRSTHHATKGSVKIGATLAEFDEANTRIGFFGVTPAARATAYTPTNVTTDRTYDADSTTIDELADILGTLIADLKLYGLLQS
jgi:hypothetical protein